MKDGFELEELEGIETKKNKDGYIYLGVQNILLYP